MKTLSINEMETVNGGDIIGGFCNAFAGMAGTGSLRYFMLFPLGVKAVIAAAAGCALHRLFS